MTDKERIKELERRVRELEARPPMVVYPSPVFVPYVPLGYPSVQPAWPHQWPYQTAPIVTCDTGLHSTVTANEITWHGAVQ